MVSTIHNFLRLSAKQKKMLPEAFFLSAYYRFQILYRPFSKISCKIGIAGYETSDNEDYRAIASEIQSVVEPVCNHTLWESKCLVRALTAKKMLNRRSCPCTLYMGVTLKKDGKMEAHAWLRCGNMFVTGGKGKKFTITGIFGDKYDI